MIQSERLTGPGGARGTGVLFDASGGLGAAALAQQVRSARADLVRRGVRSLGLLAGNGAPWIVIDLAARAAGLRVVPLPGFFTDAQLRHVLRAAEVDAVATDDPERVRGLRLDATGAGRLAGLSLLELLTLPGASCASSACCSGRPETVTFTSGTTGEPKGARLSATTLATVARSLAAATAMGPDDRHLCLLPLPVLLETVGGVYRALLAGAGLCAPPLAELGLDGSSGFDVERCVAAMERLRPTSTILVPQMLVTLVEHHERRHTRAHDGLRFVGVGGAAMPHGLLERAHAVGLAAYEGYGLTEAGSVVALSTPDARRAGSVGRALPHLEVRTAEDGELCVRGALAEGYLHGDLDRRDGWLATGDLATIDADGFIHLQGRRTNRIITAYGRNVSPEWVERELEGEPGVRRAAVFGEGRPALVAVIEAAQGAAPAAVDAALERANERLPDYARVAAWTAALAPLDATSGLTTPNGRLRRSAIAARHETALVQLHQGDTRRRVETETTTTWDSLPN